MKNRPPVAARPNRQRRLRSRPATRYRAFAQRVEKRASLRRGRIAFRGQIERECGKVADFETRRNGAEPQKPAQQQSRPRPAPVQTPAPSGPRRIRAAIGAAAASPWPSRVAEFNNAWFAWKRDAHAMPAPARTRPAASPTSTSGVKTATRQSTRTSLMVRKVRVLQRREPPDRVHRPIRRQ